MSTSRKSYKNHLKRFNNSSNNNSLNSNASNELNSLLEMFPDWEADDLATLLGEHNNLVEVVIDLIVNNKVSRWEQPKKEKPKKKEREVEEQTNTLNSDGTAHNVIPEHGHKGKHHRENFNKSKFNNSRGQQSHKKPHAKVNTKENANSLSGGASNHSSTVQPQGNSWAAALSSDKPKVTTKIESQTHSIEVNTSPSEETQAAPEEEFQKDNLGRGGYVKKARSTAKDTKDTSVSQDKPSSWASAITPKPRSKSEKTSHSQTSIRTSEQNEQGSESVPVSEVIVEETVSTQIETPIQNDDGQPQVVLPTIPREVENIGVSFGSLALGEEENPVDIVDIEQSQMQPLDIPTQQHAVAHSHHHPQEQSQPQQHHQQAQAHPAQQQQQPRHHQQQPQQQQQQQQQQTQQQPQQQQQGQQGQQQHPQQQQRYGLYNRYNQQFYQQPQQYNQSKQPQYDYYGQFQQNQQYPQQGTQTLPGVQFGVYPGIDYSAYGQQGIATSAVGSPAAAPTSMATYNQYAQNASHPASNGAPEASVAGKSPMSNQTNLNALQQQVPAPYGHPYYNYYYNTPFYGNGAGLSQSGFGMNTNASLATGNTAANGESSPVNNGISAAYMGGMNNTSASNYYAQPNQYSGRYPGYTQYPQVNQTQQLPQTNAAEGSTSSENTDSTAQAAQAAQATNQPQAPNAGQPQQPVMQYGAYQQYPQYGAYQDNSQYRGWY